MRSIPLLRAVLFGGFVLLGCQDTPEPTEPQLGKVKPDRLLTVTGGGTGSGKVTVPDVLDIPELTCEITRGTWGEADAGDCTRIYPWKSVVALTAAADPGSTFTGWSGACTGTARTCRVNMTQNRSVRANFGGGGSPSFALNIAGDGTGGGRVLSQATLNPAIDCTISAGSATGPTCSAEYVSGTSVTLSVQTSSGHSFEGWSGDCSGTGTCQLTMNANHSATARFLAPPGPEATVGRWEAPSTTPVIGLHLSLLQNGQLALWGHGGQPQTWNPASGGFTQRTNNTCSGSSCELFCSGHTFLPDGRLLVAGGHNESLGNGNGLTQASIFDGTSWQATGRMTYGRWYPTLVSLENGDVVAISGSITPNTNATIPERYNYNGTSWTALTGANASVPLYPRAFLEPKNGWIFYAGEAWSRYLDPSGTGRWVGMGTGGNHVVSNVSYGSAVMLDSLVYYVGGGGGSCPDEPENRIERIDLSSATPAWTTAGLAPMNFRRRQTNATILADGRILVTGGTGACGFTSEAGAVFAPEAYDPVTNTWAVWSNASRVRVYHSTATLLTDGRVVVTGSGDGGGVTQQLSYEVFSPPYLFKGSRPTYNLASDTMHYGQPFVVQTPNAAAIRKVNLIRPMSTTHAFDMGQRLSTLAFTVAGDGASLTVTPPTSGRKAPPGPYMLFIVDDKGVPSVAEIILLRP